MTEGRDRYDCAACNKAFVLVYEEVAPAEARELTPVACPHCDGVNYVTVARGAAYALTYRALVEKREPYDCWGCRTSFSVVYEAEPNEPGELTAVACPSCGWVNYASVARSTVGGSDRGYRTERVGRNGGET